MRAVLWLGSSSKASVPVDFGFDFFHRMPGRGVVWDNNTKKTWWLVWWFEPTHFETYAQVKLDDFPQGIRGWTYKIFELPPPSVSLKRQHDNLELLIDERLWSHRLWFLGLSSLSYRSKLLIFELRISQLQFWNSFRRHLNQWDWFRDPP